jgi:Flp pilus assembly protein TadG
MSPLLNRRRRGERGAALVELALASPILVVLIVGIVDFARIFYLGLQVTDAARAGAQYGSTPNKKFVAADVQGKAQTASPQSAPTISTPTETCACVNQNTAPTTLTTAACTAACVDPNHRTVFVTVTASKAFSPVMRFPGVPSTITISRTVTLRKE